MSAARQVTVAATQFSCTKDETRNIAVASSLVRSAAAAGAQVILLPELFASVYFCQVQDEAAFNLASSLQDSALLRHFQELSRELDVCLPISFFEVSGTAHFNSVAVFDGGAFLGKYRKSHIPDGPGYSEKFYFTPGNTGFKVFQTRFCKISVLICWDQWFPEAARCCALDGAELILYPTAIGSEPNNPSLFSRPHWQRTQCGHSAANLIPILASNRIGTEDAISFYGGSFITDGLGEIVKQFDAEQQTGFLVHTLDLDACAAQRRAWGVFRDRRPDLYGAIGTFDGSAVLPPLPPTDTGAGAAQTPPSIMPGEWAKHRACWMAWPYKQSNWSHKAGPVQLEVAALALAIARWEPVSMLVTAAEFDHALTTLPVGSGVSLFIADYDDIWVRDTGCTFVSASDGGVAAVEWQFNGWGSSEELSVDASLDNKVSSVIARLALGGRASSLLRRCSAVLEGGSFHVDGEGTLITTEECVLNPNRASESCPQRTRAALEAIFKEYLGISKVIWIPLGVHGDEDTNGHVDNLCTFVCPGHVVLTMPEDSTDPQHAISTEAYNVLTSSTDAKGRNIVVHLIAHPAPAMQYHESDLVDLAPPLVRTQGQRLAASYINHYLCSNSRGGKAIVMPRFGLPTDDVARDQLASIYRAQYPTIEVVQADSKAILLGGGNIHCITQQQPL